ncbi:rhomboid family intramembrane serine protease [archaeon]|jgi:uncharacterized protein|nr:rhomboid family intramembrane serine protease [archaeon]MBT3577248.1 rhomboid family intramembrane serine protease [archaeon]MBT6820510.1 rhomboid family intramembrane serine protease [archaeon]MBT6956441.1 rhomboid family intramembrane serine protease [archaeon]MBT7025760.1 rhomboid family intramembrane serine protease [archaeon]
MRQKIFATYTGWIIAINAVAFLVFLILLNSMSQDTVISLLALQPAAILAGKNIWTFITSMFLHAGVLHLVANMISLMFIGSFVEKLIGKKRFLTFYFVAGLSAGILFVLISWITGSDINVFAVGASGAIFGLGGLLAVLTPRLPVLVFFIIPMPMWAAMGVLMFGLWALSLAAGLPIGNTAHLGGLIIGLAYGFYLKKKYPRKTKMISRYFSR